MSNRMRLTMLTVSWLVFLTFIGLSSFANWEHGSTRISSFMLAVVPVGFAASIFLLEGIVSAGRATKITYMVIGFVALCAGVASYLGLYGMARDSDIPVVQSALLPLAFDGVVGVASMAIRAFGHAETETPPYFEESVSQPIQPDIDWEKEFAEAEVSALPAPVSPALPPSPSTETPRKEKSPRSTWDVSRVAEMAISGEPFSVAKETGIGQSTYSNVSRVARLLREDPRRDLSGAGKLPSGEVVSAMRQRLAKA